MPFALLTALMLLKAKDFDSSGASLLSALTRNVSFWPCALCGTSKSKPWLPASCGPILTVPTTAPDGLRMSTLTLVAGLSIVKPPSPQWLSGSTRSALPSVATSWPTSAAPCIVCNCVNWLSRPLTVLLRVCTPCTVLICAIWLVTCAESIGLSGSWLDICATSSFRKRSDWSCADCVAPRLDASAPAAAALALEALGSVAAEAPKPGRPLSAGLLLLDVAEMDMFGFRLD